MAAQLSIFNVSDYIKNIEQRNRFNAWENFYTVYQYDHTSYHCFCTDLRKKNTGNNEFNCARYQNLLLTLKFLKANLLLCIYECFLNTFDRTKERIFREYFYILDEDDKRIPFSDEKHIFRIKTLQKLYSIIYGYCDINLFEQFEVKRIGNIIIWGEDKQAGIANTSRLPIKERVIIHLKLLRLLRNGFSINEALERIKNE